MKHFIIKLSTVYLLLLSISAFSQTPKIIDFSPKSGPIGTKVQITGKNFGKNISKNIAYFGAVRASIISADTVSITVSVPFGATYDYLSITNTDLNLITYSKSKYDVTFDCGNIINTASYAPAIKLLNGSFSSNFSIGDFDIDGRPDIFVTNDGKPSSVFRNTSSNGNLSFANKIDFETGQQPGKSLVSDFDRDGRLDVAVMNSSSIEIILNTTSTIGSISFSKSFVIPIGEAVDVYAISDLNGDGKPDIIVMNHYATHSKMFIYKNESKVGMLSFSTVSILNDFAYGVQSIGVGDLNGDGKPEIAVPNGSDTLVSILINTTLGDKISFDTKFDFKVPTSPFFVSLADLDFDEKLDLMLLKDSINTPNIWVYRNTSSNGIISFANKISLKSSPSITSIAMGDIDGDGKSDIVAGAYGAVSLLKNNSSPGVIQFSDKIDLTDKTLTIAGRADLVDLNADGKMEVVNNFWGGSIGVFKNLVGVLSKITSNNSASICSGKSFDFPLTSDFPSTFEWSAIDNPNTQGENIFTRKGDHILDTIINNSITSQTVHYIINPKSISSTCNGPSLDFFLIVNPLPSPPTITANGPLVLCFGDSVRLSSTPAEKYLWNLNGQTTQSIIVKPATNSTINLTITDKNNCQSSSTSTIIVNPIPDKPIISSSGPTTFCSGENVILSCSPEKNYLWSNGAITQNIIINSSGSYWVQTTNKYNCKSYLSEKEIVDVLQAGHFSFKVDGMTVEFKMNDAINCGGIGFMWDYGNGMTSTIAQKPFVTYNNSGKYTACLKCSSSKCITCADITVPGNYTGNTVNIEEVITNDMIIVYPNPFYSDVQIEFTTYVNNYTIELLNQYGYKLQEIKNVNGRELTVKSSGLAPGIYFLKIYLDKETIVKKLIKY